MTILTGNFFPGYKYIKETNTFIGKYGRPLKPYFSTKTKKRYYNLKNKYGEYLHWNERRLLRIWLKYDPDIRLKAPVGAKVEVRDIIEELELI